MLLSFGAKVSDSQLIELLALLTRYGLAIEPLRRLANFREIQFKAQLDATATGLSDISTKSSSSSKGPTNGVDRLFLAGRLWPDADAPTLN